MKAKKMLFIPLVAVVACSSLFAHSGRTDGKGGHRDKKNVSGLGSYHYHCGGFPAHLHDGGVCPYSSTSSSNAPTVTKESRPKYTEKTVTFSIGGETKKVDAVNANNTKCPYSSTSSSNAPTVTKESRPKYTEKTVTFSIGGETKKVDAVNANNTNLVELRTLCDKLGITIENYDSTLKTIDCKKDDVAFTLQIDSNTMWKGTELVTLDVAPIIHNGKTMIPARVIAEAIGKTVNYDAATDSIVID